MTGTDGAEMAGRAGRGVPGIHEIVICGAGAVGGSWLEPLQALEELDPAARVRLRVLAGGERRARLLGDGLTVNGRRLDVRCVVPGEAGPPADLLVVAVKQPQLASAVEDMAGLVGLETILLPLLNGITSEEVLGRAFGPERVLHAFVVGNDVVREGSALRFSRMGEAVFGAASNDPSDPRVLAVKEVLERAGIACRVPADIRREQWWKFMLNCGVNQVSAVLRATYGAMVANPEARDLTLRVAREVVEVARREGVALEPAEVEKIFPLMATLAPDGRTSMLQDVDAGRKTEVESFAGTVVALGRRHGVPTPVNEVLGLLIAALERLAGVGG